MCDSGATHIGQRAHVCAESCVFFKIANANELLKGTDACMVLLLSVLCVNSDPFTHTAENRRLASHPLPDEMHLKSIACTAYNKPLS